MRMYDIIEKKRDGMELSNEEIKFFISGVCNESIPDYQTAALLMAIYIQGMNTEETTNLTYAMANSGEIIDLSSIKGIKVDKHSTGGVGDKTTLVVAPIVAACGIPVVKMSGRGLGFTGGTIDKLESIPGFKVDLSKDEIIKNVIKYGISLTSQSENIAPADKKLYALRDVTATVESIPLIASSVMCKKIAAGADKILLDVKCGSGAFMKTLEQALKLAGLMTDIGKKSNRETVALVSNMDLPLGNAIGNTQEIIEALETLKGRGPDDLTSISLELASQMIYLAWKDDTVDLEFEYCREKAKEILYEGKALCKMRDLIKAQGGNEEIIKDYNLFKQPVFSYEVKSEDMGYVESINANLIGKASVLLGAGRQTKEDRIDHSAGIYIYKNAGMKVAIGETIAMLYTDNKNAINEASEIVKESYKFCGYPPEIKPLILAYVDSKHVYKYGGKNN